MPLQVFIWGSGRRIPLLGGHQHSTGSWWVCAIRHRGFVVVSNTGHVLNLGLADLCTFISVLKPLPYKPFPYNTEYQ